MVCCLLLFVIADCGLFLLTVFFSFVIVDCLLLLLKVVNIFVVIVDCECGFNVVLTADCRICRFIIPYTARRKGPL